MGKCESSVSFPSFSENFYSQIVILSFRSSNNLLFISCSLGSCYEVLLYIIIKFYKILSTFLNSKIFVFCFYVEFDKIGVPSKIFIICDTAKDYPEAKGALSVWLIWHACIAICSNFIDCCNEVESQVIWNLVWSKCVYAMFATKNTVLPE